MTCSNALRGGISLFSSYLKEMLDFAFPKCCCICGRLADADDRFSKYEDFSEALSGKPSGLHVCGKCLSSLAPYESDKRWLLCLSDPYDGDPCPGLPLYLPLAYEGMVKRAMPMIKFGKKPCLARLFGCLLGTFMASDSVHADLIVPVPLSPKRMKERGFNQAAEIAKPASAILGIPYADDVLYRNRNTNRQTELKGNLARIANVTGAFGVSEEWDLTGMTVIVVDDVVTTGFTLHEAAAALYEAGAEKVLCAAFAGSRQIKLDEPF
ncbi:MAG: ComF family protein [Clostridiales bacterium]|nr:ComF family protein [Clostridiales bacterium]